MAAEYVGFSFNVKHFFVLVEMLLNTVLCQNGVIPGLSAWASIVGLLVAVWTLWNVQSVRKTLENFRNQRLLSLRLPAHLKELHGAWLVIGEAAFETKNVKLDRPSLVSATENVLKICENIKTLDVTRSISFAKINAVEEIAKRISGSDSTERKTIQKHLEPLAKRISALIAEIKVLQDNTKKEISDGFR